MRRTHRPDDVSWSLVGASSGAALAIGSDSPETWFAWLLAAGILADLLARSLRPRACAERRP